MKSKRISALITSMLALAYTVGAMALGGPVTLTGSGACAKCQLKEGKTCQITLTAVEDGRKTTYYIRDNAQTKEFGKQLCAETKQLRVTGDVQSVDGRFELTPTKIEVVKPTL
jgi:hypothetical protein